MRIDDPGSVYAAVEGVVSASGAVGAVFVIVGDDGTFTCASVCSKYDSPERQTMLLKAASAAGRALEADGYQCRTLGEDAK